MSTAPTTPRPSVMQLAIKEKAALYAAYIPFFEEGGIFVPTPKRYFLGDEVFLLQLAAGQVDRAAQLALPGQLPGAYLAAGNPRAPYTVAGG